MEEGFSGTEEGPINRGQLLHKPNKRLCCNGRATLELTKLGIKQWIMPIYYNKTFY